MWWELVDSSVVFMLVLIVVFLGLWVWTLFPTDEQRAIDIATNEAVIQALQEAKNVDFNVYSKDTGEEIYRGTATPMGYVQTHYRRRNLG